jgi:Bacterial Ig-like domain (group 2)
MCHSLPCWQSHQSGSGMSLRACAILLFVLAPGCVGLPFGACTDELGVEIRPRERTIRVGESFQAQATGITCGGRKRWKMEMYWATVDTSIIRVDRGGQVNGLKPGFAAVEAYEPPDTSFSWGSVQVRVLAW